LEYQNHEGGGRDLGDLFLHCISVSNLLDAWNEFKGGKRKKHDVADFEMHLEDRIFRLHKELITKKYIHDPYFDFYVCDPKRRHIHKATVRDRVLHQAIFRVLYPIFDKHFIFDSYSSRNNKGTHAGVERLVSACRKETDNWKNTAYALKCDVRKFFDSIDQKILRDLITKKVSDPDMMWLIDLILASFEKEKGKALPLGNVTSQLFANVYLDELDQFAKHVLKAKHYFRYCDDFIIVYKDKKFLENMIPKLQSFLKNNLQLELHPNKVEIRKVRQGIDFLGYVTLNRGVNIVRTNTKHRIVRKVGKAKRDYGNGKISDETFKSIINSYLGVLSHARERVFTNQLKKFL
jgi:retron-type reverse transcriptase